MHVHIQCIRKPSFAGQLVHPQVCHNFIKVREDTLTYILFTQTQRNNHTCALRSPSSLHWKTTSSPRFTSKLEGQIRTLTFLNKYNKNIFVITDITATSSLCPTRSFFNIKKNGKEIVLNWTYDMYVCSCNNGADKYFFI